MVQKEKSSHKVALRNLEKSNLFFQENVFCTT